MRFFIILIALSLIIFTGKESFSKEPATRKIPVVSFDELYPLLNRNNDTTYVINFWATWCAPCIREIPAFEKLYEKYQAQKVKVILVSLDFPDHLQSRVIPFVERMDVKSDVILLDDPDANRWIPLVSENWTGAIPATLIYNRETRQFFQREFYFEELEQIILSMLNKNRLP
ncbi:MAG TPA: TlpA disulfide reductase family protein [Bacteroidales bacterium]|nr:TlpA disulfide reductase family protein [Bacteroidales bacterium]